MASELEETIRTLESRACKCDATDGLVCDCHKIVSHLRELIHSQELKSEVVVNER